MTSTYLKFDGRQLNAYDSETDQLLGSWNAVSGRSVYDSDTGTWDVQYLDPQYQSIMNYGPIPEGDWYVPVSMYQDINANVPNWEYLKGILGGGLTPGNEFSWGNGRIKLVPDVGTNTFSRDGFYIHGGNQAGSAGCIDLTDEAAFMNFITQYEGAIKLTVEKEGQYIIK